MKGFTLEDATGLTVNGDIDIDYVFAGSLSSNWQAPSIPDEELVAKHIMKCDDDTFVRVDASTPGEKEEPEQNGQRKSIHLLPMFLVLYGPVVQNGRREHGDVGTVQQQRQVCGLCAQDQLLPVWLHREDYLRAHYQSPRQMICLWDKLVLTGKPH
ncbi:unnamed protein product [Arabidopsis arenosa]|uniref:Hexosyltransferase n=1 Tax=Arabidopsis arenosa TaxID=38785 RepID=A0A8S2AHT6_ARAAE|nr:unnamed protein product [Arabidopsis arenosa]